MERNTSDPTELDDGTRVVVEYVGVRSRSDEPSTLETEIVENGLTDDGRDDTAYLAEYHSENDRYPRRRLVVGEDGMRLEARRSTEDGTLWAKYAKSGSVEVVDVGTLVDDPNVSVDEELTARLSLDLGTHN